MTQKSALYFSVLLCLWFGNPGLKAGADELKKPVFFLKYYFGQGLTEATAAEEETDTDLSTSTLQHTTSLRIREEFSKRFKLNLLFYFTRKEFLLGSESYNYFYALPDITLDMTDKLELYAGFKSKWKYFDEPDSNDNSKDYVNLSLKAKLTFKPLHQLSIMPFLYSNFDLYTYEQKSVQYYDFGLTITNKWEHVTLSGKYKGQTNFPLTGESTITTRFNNEFGINLTWDPN